MKKRILVMVLVLSILTGDMCFCTFHTQAKNGNLGTINFTQSYAYMVNPFMGNVTTATVKTRVYDGLLVFGQAQWSDLEPTEGVYAFSTFEKLNNFDYWIKEKNNKFILSFNMDNPDKSLGRDIPNWLYDQIKQEAIKDYNQKISEATLNNDTIKLAKLQEDLATIQRDAEIYTDFVNSGKEKANIPGVGTYYSYDIKTENGQERRGGFSPNYSSQVLINAHHKLMKALGEQYDHPDKVFLICMGSLGHWGEMHTTYVTDLNDVGRYPDGEIAHQYENEYALCFNHILVSSRYPRDVAKENGFGLHNHGLGSNKQTYDWFVDYYEGGYTNYVTGEEYPAMIDFWKKAPCGAEILYTGDMHYFYDDQVDTILQQAKDIHVSYFHEDTVSTDEVKKNVTKLLSEIGYRFVLERSTYDTTGKPGGTIELLTNWSNKGVAPFYFEWPIVAEIRSKTGKVIATKTIETNVTTLQPDISKMYKTLIEIPSNTAKGEYDIYLGIMNPVTKKAEIKLAITQTGVNNMYKVGAVQISSSAANLDPKPVDLKNLTIYGSNEIAVYSGDTSSRFNIIARNEASQTVGSTLEWYVKNNQNATINQNGVVTIKGGTTTGTFVVGARIKGYTSLYVEKSVKLSEAKIIQKTK